MKIYQPFIEILDVIIRRAEILSHKTTIDIEVGSIPFYKSMKRGVAYSEMADFIFELEKKGLLKIVDSNAVYGFIRISSVNVEDVKKYRDELLSQKEKQEIHQIPKVFFDPKLCVLKYREKKYTLQRKKGRCEILKELWKSRRIVNSKNEIKREGSFKLIWELAIAGGFVKNEEEFEEKKRTAERSVRDAIQDLRKKFKEMGAPVKIVAQNGYLLVIKEN